MTGEEAYWAGLGPEEFYEEPTMANLTKLTARGLAFQFQSCIAEHLSSPTWAEIRRRLERLEEAEATLREHEEEHWCFNDEHRVNRERLEQCEAALAMLYDKWENGDPCYEDVETSSGYLGNAFRLSNDEEKEILALIPAARTAVEGK